MTGAAALFAVTVAVAVTMGTAFRVRLVACRRPLVRLKNDLTSARVLSSKAAMNGTLAALKECGTPLSRRLARRLGIGMTAIVFATNPAAAVAVDSSLIPRVRSTHAYIRAMIDEAVERSQTFRGLVKAIEASDGIVYVEQGACGHNVHACLTMQVTAAGEYRILRAVVDARQPDWEVMGSIAHELQHGLEVLGNRTLTSTTAVILFFSREGIMSQEHAFETPAAVKVGNAVRNEVGSFARRKQS